MKSRLIALTAGVLFSAQVLAAPYQAGDIPFDQVGKTLESEDIKISDYKGKVVIVSFWASWCGPCRKELPVLAAIQKKATPDKLQVISINIDEERSTFKKLAALLENTQIKLVHDGKKRTGRKFGVEGIPHMVMIDEAGKVASVHVGYSEAQLPALINEINEIANRAP
jgi:thiol-disulfide isomerase/thioredoxin